MTDNDLLWREYINSLDEIIVTPPTPDPEPARIPVRVVAEPLRPPRTRWGWLAFACGVVAGWVLGGQRG